MNGKFEEHLQSIRDLIQIDDKIVTYKWVSKVLKVHINTAKQLLYSFIKKAEGKEQLLITYIVAGEPNSGSGLNVSLVREDELEETKKKLSKVTSIHVYSVHKGITVSSADIYNADGACRLSPEDQKYCSIQPAKNIGRRDVNIVPPRKDPGPSVSSKKPVVSQSSKPADYKNKEPALSSGDTKEQAAKRTSPRKASPKKNDSKKPAATTKAGGIGALFMKQAAKIKEDTAVKAAKKKEDEEKKTREASDAKEEENTENSKEEIKKKPVSGKDSDKNAVINPPTKSKSQPKKKRKKASDSKDPAAKRRKRIQIASDSESSEESESDGDHRYPSPEPGPEAPVVVESEEEIIPATPVERGRKRVRKLVDRTYEDDEGYIITKKEYVFESCSDDESSEPEEKMTSSKETASSKPEEKSVEEPQKQSTSAVRKEDGKKDNIKKDNINSEGGNKIESTGRKPGRPPSKAKVSSSDKKQASIMNFFKKQ